MNIPALHTDVIRRVIGYSAHCDHPIAEIQRVSQLWRDLVDEEFDRISNLLQVDEILTSTDRSSAKGFQMMLKIRKNGLDFAHRFLHHFGYKKVNNYGEMYHLRKFVQLKEVRQKRSNDLRALRVVNKVVLKQLSARLNNLPCIFRHIRTEEVHCWSPHVAINQSIIKLLRQWNVSKLHLELADYASANLSTDDFLLQLADSVDVLHIQQSKPFQYRKFSYLIGEHDLPIISEMLARRVSKLKIEHDNRAIEADYGSLIALAQAREVAKIQGKQSWFEMNARFPLTRNNTSAPHSFLSPFAPYSMHLRVEELVLAVRPTTASDCLISIKHHTREREEFHG